MKSPKTVAAIVVFVVLVAAWWLWPRSTRSGPAAGSPKQLKQVVAVSFRNPIPEVSTGQTPLLVGNELGYYAEQNLTVNFEPGGPEVNPVKMVAAGQNDFGMVGGPETLLVARSKGLPLRAIAVLHRHSNFPCFLTLESSGITKLADMQGKKVGFFPGHITTDVLKPLLRRNGVAVDAINVGFDYNPLITGQIAGEWGFTVRAALELPAKGIKVNILRASDYGIQTNGYTIFTTEKMIAEHPDTCEQLLRGIFKGIDFTLAHRSEAADILQKLNPALTDRDFVLKSEAMYDEVMSHSAEYPAGYMDREMFATPYEYLTEEKSITHPFNVDDAFTTQFLERIHHRKF